MADDELSALELQAWGGFLRTHAVLYQELERRLDRGQGMTISTYDVLLRLSWAGDAGLRMSELANQVLKTSGGLTRLADRLERDGLIKRARSSDDLRGFEARITPEGRKALRRANRQHLRDVRELFLGHLTEDQLTILAGAWRDLRAVFAELGPAASAAAEASAEVLEGNLSPASGQRRGQADVA